MFLIFIILVSYVYKHKHKHKHIKETFYNLNVKYLNANDFKKFSEQPYYLELLKYFNILEIVVKSNFIINKELVNKPIFNNYVKTIKEFNNALENRNNKLHNLQMFNFKLYPLMKINLKNIFLNNLTFFYKHNIVNIVNEQKSLLKGLITDVDNALFEKMERLPQWNFVFLKNNIDWNYPYTIGNVIFMTEMRLNSMLSNYTNIDEDVSNISKITMIHEYIHILQRLNPEIFQSFYQIYYKFKIIPLDKRNNILGDLFLKTYWITNPDGLNGEYYIEYEKEIYTPFLMLDPNDIKKHKPVLVKLDSDFNILYNESSKKTYKNEMVNNVKIPIMFDLEKSKIYQRYTFGIEQNYHPNEIYANMVSTYIINEGLINSEYRTLAKESTKLLKKLKKY